MRILYLFWHSVEDTYRQFISGEIPSDHMYGAIEIKKLGYDLSFMDYRPKGLLGYLFGFINNKYGFRMACLKAILALRNYDIIVVRGTFSTILTIACKVFNKKIVYLDALYTIPQNWLRKLILKMNMKYATGIVVFSKTQIKLWSKLFNISPSRFKFLPYTIDVSFYKYSDSDNSFSRPYILSVGRDMARDYKTFVEAVIGLGVDVKIVSIPYLMRDVNLSNPAIEFLEYIPYNKLFDLYSKALFVVIPLKRWGIVYPSGIRALHEALKFRKCVIASHSPILEEYVKHEEGVLYVDPENAQELRKTIMSLLQDSKRRLMLEKKTEGIIEKKYNMDVFATEFGNYLSGLLKEKQK
jgi:glycosyltransferase involved in cell wall biosynthesis